MEPLVRLERTTPCLRCMCSTSDELQRRCTMVRPTGFKPVTSALGGRRSIRLSYGRIIGGTRENRTRIPSLEVSRSIH